MGKSITFDKSKAFALRIIKVCNEVKRERKESILTNQLVRSGTSIGANIREAFYAHGRADFIAKLQRLPLRNVLRVNIGWSCWLKAAIIIIALFWSNALK